MQNLSIKNYHPLHLGGIEYEVDDFQAVFHHSNASLSTTPSWLVIQFLWQNKDAMCLRNLHAGRTLGSHVFVIAQGFKHLLSIHTHAQFISSK